jgi:hypothetical protein
MARAVIAAALIVAGGVVALPGLFLLIGGAGATTGGPVGQLASATGSAVGAVPFAGKAAGTIASVAA